MSFFGWFRRPDESNPEATPPTRGKAPPTPRPRKPPPPPARAKAPPPAPAAPGAPASRPTLADDDRAVCQAVSHISKRRFDSARALLRAVVRRSPPPPKVPRTPNPLRPHSWDPPQFAAYL